MTGFFYVVRVPVEFGSHSLKRLFLSASRRNQSAWRACRGHTQPLMKRPKKVHRREAWPISRSIRRSPRIWRTSWSRSSRSPRAYAGTPPNDGISPSQMAIKSMWRCRMRTTSIPALVARKNKTCDSASVAGTRAAPWVTRKRPVQIQNHPC